MFVFIPPRKNVHQNIPHRVGRLDATSCVKTDDLRKSIFRKSKKKNSFRKLKRRLKVCQFGFFIYANICNQNIRSKYCRSIETVLMSCNLSRTKSDFIVRLRGHFTESQGFSREKYWKTKSQTWNVLITFFALFTFFSSLPSSFRSNWIIYKWTESRIPIFLFY